MRQLSLVACAAAVVAAASATLAAATADFTPPTGYRQWFHVNSQLVDSTSPSFAQLGGLHNVYVNAIGQPALESNAPYPDGSVFADDVHKFTVSSGTYTEGARAALVVMKEEGREALRRHGRLGIPGLGRRGPCQALGDRPGRPVLQLPSVTDGSPICLFDLHPLGRRDAHLHGQPPRSAYMPTAFDERAEKGTLVGGITNLLHRVTYRGYISVPLRQIDG
jgi:hypothetical protein